MSTIPAVLISIALFVLALAPLAVAYRYPRARVPAALIYGLLLVGLTVRHTGLSFGNVPSATAATAEPGAIAGAGAGAGAAPSANDEELVERCTEALQMAEEGMVIRDMSDPARLVVNASLWAQLPDFVKETMVLCVEKSQPGGPSAADIEIVEE